MAYTKDNIVFEPHPISKKGPRFKDLEGQSFHRLTILGYAGKRGHNQFWWCECQCGTVTKTSAANLHSGHTTSCGCFAKEIRQQTLHGESRRGKPTAEYTAYAQAKGRCNNENNQEFKHYGGRGIKFRLKSVQDILDTIGRRPSRKHTLDRIDVEGHYEVGNIQWATQREQQNNRRNNLLLTVDGRTQSAAMWARERGMNPITLYNRLYRGWSPSDAVTLPLHTKIAFI